jgi:DNA-binding CsgD family transcriptional regulator
MHADAALLCPVLIERESELERLTSYVEEAAAGRGGVTVLVGEAGIGKSRLCREVATGAAARGFATLSGRAADGSTVVPYRPLTEALLGAFRSTAPPSDRELAGFGGQLGRLVPQWRRHTSDGADESPILLGEAVVRLLRVLGGDDGCLLLLEDLQWADVETLAVVEYLADALVGQPTLCVCTGRPEGAVLETLARLRRSATASVLGLSPLSGDGVERAIACCLATEHVPHDVLACIASNSEGNPFLIEELLAGLAASGALRSEPGQWVTTGRLTPTVPFDFGESIHERLSALDDTGRLVVRAAALLGRRFDSELVACVADVDEAVVLDALRVTVAEQIVAVEEDDFIFRHALTRQAVLDELLPPERRDLARRAWPAIERAHPGLPGPWCELAAELAETAGDPVAAATYLVESASRALVGGAFATAEATASRARLLAGDDLQVGIDADEVLVQVLALAGKTVPATTVGRSLLDRLVDNDCDDDRQADLLVTLARAALAGGDGAAAVTRSDEARVLVESGRVDASVVARVEAVAAHVALDQGSFDRAETLARSAVARAVATVQPDVECEALEVLGRVERFRAKTGADWFERAADVAERHGLTGWLLRARHELAVLEWANHGRTEQLHETRDLAAKHGALVTVAVMDLSLADVALGNFDRDGCLDAAQRCVDASRRYRLATLPVAYLWLAGAHALAGRDAEMEDAAANALAEDPDDPRILGDLWGRVRATRSIVRDDRAQLRVDLDAMMTFVRVAPAGTSVFPNRLLWALLRTAEDDDHGVPARAELATTQLDAWQPFLVVREMIDIVAEGRTHPGDELASRFAELSRYVHGFHAYDAVFQYIHVVAAEAAIRDHWGDPVSWLRHAEAFFSAGSYPQVARRCRRQLGQAGAPMPRHGRGEAVVPPSLRALGITSRELDVLRLVAEGRSNREIAERLYVSPKTVERHVASLFHRTGLHDRHALGEFAHALDQ